MPCAASTSSVSSPAQPDGVWHRAGCRWNFFGMFWENWPCANGWSPWRVAYVFASFRIVPAAKASTMPMAWHRAGEAARA